MSQHNIRTFLKVLEDRLKDFEWCSRDQPSSYLGKKGCYSTANAHVVGFEIIITEHSYGRRDYPNGVPDEIRYRRRGVTIRSRNWIEVSIVDEMARYGRRMILDRQVFLSGTPEYEKLLKMLSDISGIGKYFDPNAITRLSPELALESFCKRIK